MMKHNISIRQDKETKKMSGYIYQLHTFILGFRNEKVQVLTELEPLRLAWSAVSSCSILPTLYLE